MPEDAPRIQAMHHLSSLDGACVRLWQRRELFRDCCMDRENGLADEWAYEQWITEREQELDEERRGGYVQGFCGSDGSRDASLSERALVGSRGGFEEFD